MQINKQRQMQVAEPAAKTEQDYTWSTTRVIEGVTINVITFLFIALLGLLGGMIYAAWLLVLNLLHTPSELVGILAFILLGAVFGLLTLIVALILWIRRMRPATAAGMVIGAVVGAAIGARLDSRSRKSGGWDIDAVLAEAAAKVQAQAKKAESEKERTHEQQ